MVGCASLVTSLLPTKLLEAFAKHSSSKKRHIFSANLKIFEPQLSVQETLFSSKIWGWKAENFK